MTWSLQVKNGDFTVDSARLGTVSGSAKLVQDLSHYLLERMGTDTLHPAYGSLLDGGVTPNGRVAESLLGETDFNHIALLVESEIRRIATAYQASQVARAKADRLTYNKTTLTAEEMLVAVSDVDFRQNMDVLEVVISIRTGTGTTTQFVLPLSETPLLST